MVGPGRWLVLVKTAGRFLAHRRTRYVLAWLLTLGLGSWVVIAGLTSWDKSNRPDGTAGHTSIDFGGSWIMGRMLVRGQARYLYDRNRLRNVLHESYPRADEAPDNKDKTSEAENFLAWFVGRDKPESAVTFASCAAPLAAPDGLGAVVLAAAGQEKAWQPSQMEAAASHVVSGPLYPPINAFLVAPLAVFRPATAFRIHQVLDVGLLFLAAWGICVLSGRRIWLPVAVLLLALFPGFHGNHVLAQNSGLSLTVLVWGWVLIARERPGWGGAVWGLLAFKPVWALSFILVLLLSRRWGGFLAMAGVGLLQIALTLPVVGIEPWFDWLQVGREAATWYNFDVNWVHLSRDLLGLPRRYLLDFDLPGHERDNMEATVTGWTLFLSVAAGTVLVAVLRWRQVRETTGPGAAFLLLGGWLSCFHFMYYDVLLAWLPVMLLFTEPREYLRPGLLRRAALEWAVTLPLHSGSKLQRLRLLSASAYGWICNPFPLLVLLALLAIENPLQLLGYSDDGPPFNTYCLLALWLWCGVVCLARRTPGTAGSVAVAQRDVLYNGVLGAVGQPVMPAASP